MPIIVRKYTNWNINEKEKNISFKNVLFLEMLLI